MADTIYDRLSPAPLFCAVGAKVIDYSGGDVDVLAFAKGKPRALYITTAGNLKVDTAQGDIGVVHPVVTGYVPLSITKIYQTGSTAAGAIWW